ncbi:MAG: 3-dehydroquinate synthase II [Candidatus Syntropharchaeia archaeon]
MKKLIWIKADEGRWEDKKERITTGMESGADCILVNEEDVENVLELGNISVAAFSTEKGDILVVGKGGEGDGTKEIPKDINQSADLNLLKELSEKGKKTAAYVEIKGKEYERFAVKISDFCDYLIVIGKDWKVIPLENLIAELQRKEVKIIAGVKTSEEAKTAIETLEHGADGVLIDTDDLSEIKRTAEIIEKLSLERIPLTVARVTCVKPVGMGDRVCVDTCSLMVRGEGMLVGSQSDALFLVHSESEESPYVAARPFRVNAGAVHAYILIGDKTRYLSELSAGDEVLILNWEGIPRKAVVGRVKIEKRPLLLVEAEADGKKIKTLLQNAETIKLVGKDGNPISVADLREGDEVLVHIEEKARHFGIGIEESVIEK